MKMFFKIHASLSVENMKHIAIVAFISIPCWKHSVRVTRSLILCVCFVDRCLSFWSLCCLSFDLRILITLWYLQTRFRNRRFLFTPRDTISAKYLLAVYDESNTHFTPNNGCE